MTKQGTILIVDDNKGVLAAIDMLLSGTFKKVITISNPNRIPAMLETENIDVVLLDMNFSSGINNGNEGIFWLGEIRKISNDLPVVLFTYSSVYSYPDFSPTRPACETVFHF